MTTSLATVAEYETLTGSDVEVGAQMDRVQAMLDAASAAIRTYTGQTITRARTLGERVELEGYRQTILLAEVPLVESVDDELIVLDPAGELVPRDHYDVDIGSSALKHCDCRPWAPGCYAVTYSHGYDPVPADLVALTTGLVQAGLSVPAGVRAQSVGAYSVTYADDAGGFAVGGAVLDGYRISDLA